MLSVFCDVEKWQSLWPDLFGPVQWTLGEPWKLMSRLRLKIFFPAERDLEAVLLSQDHLSSAWLVRGQQVAVQQWFRLDPQPEGGVVFSTLLEFVGIAPQDADRIRTGYTELYRGWFARIEKEAQRREERQTAKAAPFASLTSWL